MRSNTIWPALAATLGLLVCIVPYGSAAPLIVGIDPQLPAPLPGYEEVQDPQASKFAPLKGTQQTIRIRKTYNTPSTNQAWQAVFDYLRAEHDLDLKFEPASSQLDFELKLARGYYDLAYINPIQFVNFNRQPGYKAIAKRKAQPIRGVIVVNKQGPIKTLAELRGQTLVFPGLLDFPASIAPRESLQRLKVAIKPAYLRTQTEVYQAIVDGQYLAGGGSIESFEGLPPELHTRLRVIWQTPGYTPHAFAAHPRVSFFSIRKLQKALIGITKKPAGKKLLPNIFVENGFEAAGNNDWHDIRLINLKQLNDEAMP